MMYRPNSVFVSTGRFANFLLVVWLLVFGFSGYLLLRHKRGRGLPSSFRTHVCGALAVCPPAASFSGASGRRSLQRAFVWGAPWRQREVIRVLRNVQRAAIGIGLPS